MTLEARCEQASLWKKIVDSTKELVSEVNFQCDPSGMTMQSMDAAHVALVAMSLKKEAFDLYHMERSCCIGLNLTNFSKVLKTVENSDSLLLRHTLDENTLDVECQQRDGGKKARGGAADADAAAGTGAASASNRMTTFTLKLMEIDTDQLSAPGDMDFKAMITMSSAEFSKICRDMNVFGDTITVSVSKDGVVFKSEGDIGTGQLQYKCPVNVTRSLVKTEWVDEDDSNFGAGAGAAAHGGGVKQEVKNEIKAEAVDEDAPLANLSMGAGRRSGNAADADGAASSIGMHLSLVEPCELSFALRYFTNFSKGQALSDRVTIALSQEQPCMVEFTIENTGYIRYYLAPKVESME